MKKNSYDIFGVNPEKDRLIYVRSTFGMPSVEPSRFDFEFDSPDINEFKNACILLAQSLGYHKDNIRECFGDISTPKSCIE